ncbi:DUF1772 domain-containing protein [Mucilaginibacter flavidus]|uniref:DUF1772 domain-containing protein n=1 Tax=Mucilaginibacter flavidus TaxID=2949309 RepID=UPI00209322E7|nr:DUF1772 domain-containing protein [Mucilaginibacter flavidus]MCO5946656.1 DUF1772 domain-containing protein [Mucilaginibacter flavidus]
MRTLVLLPLSALLNFNSITIFGNVPLNDALAHIDLPSLSSAQVAEQRNAFEKPWLVYYNIRTAANVICLVLVMLGCMYKKMPG